MIKYCIFFLLISISCFSQTIHQDTVRANRYYNYAIRFDNNSIFDSAIFYVEKTRSLYTRHFGIKSQINASLLNQIGGLYYKLNMNDKSLDYHTQALQIQKEILGEKDPSVAESYNSIGEVYDKKGEYDNALEYYLKAVMVRKVVFGEASPSLTDEYNNIAIIYGNKGNYDEALKYHFKALEIKRENFGENSSSLASSYGNIGIIYDFKGEYDTALEYYLKGLEIDKANLGENNVAVAADYSNIGALLREKVEYTEALKYLFKALKILDEIPGDNRLDIAGSCFNVGVIYLSKGEYDTSLEYFLKALRIKKDILPENHPDFAAIYNNLGVIYDDKGENDKSLEYHQKTLQIVTEAFGENHPEAARSYINIGRQYNKKGEYNKALEDYLKALRIYREILGENNVEVASALGNIGLIYTDKGDFDKAFDYLFQSLRIKKAVLGEKNPEVANGYDNMGRFYHLKGEYDKALNQYFKALQVRIAIYTEKHPDLAKSYINIGFLYDAKGEYDKELGYLQKSIASCLPGFTDTVNLASVPVIKDFFDWSDLLTALQSKGQTIGNERINLNCVPKSERREIAVRQYQACDTIIDLTRKRLTSQSDKFALGEKAGTVYKEVIELICSSQRKFNEAGVNIYRGKDAELAFYFSEKNKSSVLLEALAGQEAIKFAGIPDSLLRHEINLKNAISFYSKSLAEPEKLTHAQKNLDENFLFSANSSYDSLIADFEKQYPEYYNLKYNNKPVTIKEIQNLLDKKTAMISFVTGDSSIFIFTLTKRDLNVRKVTKIVGLDDTIALFRYGLTLTSPKMKESYRRIGSLLYNQLFPKGAITDNNIENLIIIPDGALSTIPFESLLTSNYIGKVDNYADYPFLIKKYNISYTYSANLFYKTFQKKLPLAPETAKGNDWLAFAPVFNETATTGTRLISHVLEKSLRNPDQDSVIQSRSMFDRSFISPLPATATETENILKLFDEKNLRASVLLHDQANEQFIKSGGLSNYRILHFATHGFVNSRHPELSGILLAPDTTGKEDGVLYSGELFNLKLNADLVVLSACETGLGKIQKGEGIIGLTRALLYAGAKNLIVSLWQVADESTSELMVNFYKNYLDGNNKVSYSQALRNAKLSMIKEGKYSHPLFWSPFIVIGK